MATMNLECINLIVGCICYPGPLCFLAFLLALKQNPISVELFWIYLKMKHYHFKIKLTDVSWLIGWFTCGRNSINSK